MFKLLIADDEPIVRKGLFDTLKWDEYNITVVDMAVNGKDALEIAEREKPDICLIDICMPLINGLDLIEKLKEFNPEVITIIVTGHDEFGYAQRAVTLKAFDYILKPVYEEDLRRVIKNAIKELEESRARHKSYEWANDQLKKNLPVLKSKFLLDWINGELTKEEAIEQLQFHNIELGQNMGLVVLKLKTEVLNYKIDIQWERQLLIFAIQNIYEEILLSVGDFNCIRDDNENIVGLVTINSRKDWKDFKETVESNVERYLHQKVVVYQSEIINVIEDISTVYEEIKKEMFNEICCLPIIRKVKMHIDRNYKDQDLSLQKFADDLEVNCSYLSTLFKQELGISFTDYIIKVRVTEAIRLMNDIKIKIYEISEQVGYSSQHYFCNAFKKVFGISPSEYRQKNI